MAGGTWLSQNKIRPACYINFKSVSKKGMTVGDRGIVAMGLPLSWGAEGKLIEVLSTDLVDGNSQKLIGFTAYDSESKLLAGALNYCYKALVYRMDAGGSKASLTIGNLTATAKYNGTFGNKLKIVITRDSNNGLYNVITYVGGESVNAQKVTEIAELENNAYVDFSGTGELEENAGSNLTGGLNGTVTTSTAYAAMFRLLKLAKWQTYVCFDSDTTIKSNVVSFIQNLRDSEGRYVQGVVADYDGADYEGIINSISGVVINDVTYTKEEFVAIVGGLTAGANFNESNTAKVINGATIITNELTDTEIKEALENGKFLLSTSTSGQIKVEQDINSLHTYTKDKDYNFSKNRIIRTLDEIGTTTKMTWEDTYMGKVDNNVSGRNSFKGDLVQYGKKLEQLNAIQEFDGSTDIEIAQGEDLDSVVVNWGIKPVDSMEKLYMTVNVNS